MTKEKILTERNGNCYVGFDVGSDTVHTIILNEKGRIVYAPKSLMHFGNPVNALKETYENVINFTNSRSIKAIAFTGSAGKSIAKVTKSPFYFDPISISVGAEIIAPDAEYIIHLGSKDPYFFEREIDKESTGKSFVSDHDTGTKCGGGSGILINKQVRRFFADEFSVQLRVPDDTDDIREREKIKRENREKMQLQMEGIHQKAWETILSSDKDLDVGGRCGVIIQSDMIHMQNSGEQIRNILKGMYVRIAKNYKNDVIGTRPLDKSRSAIGTGAAFLNEYLAALFSEELGVKIELPENFEKIGAAGAALKALREKRQSLFNLEDLDSVIEIQKQEIKFAPPLSSVLTRVHIYPEEKAIIKTENELIIYKQLKEPTKVIIGMDGGSTTTKALIAGASDLSIIAEICLDTDGKPLETAQKIFKEIRFYIGKKITISGIAYTGSSGEFYYRMFTDFKKSLGSRCVDIVKDEITCHACGVKHYNNTVDTIFECGGQDAKFTVFNKDGTVKKAKMNLSCMAGTGQSMKNMLDMLGFDFNTFRDYSLMAKRTPVTDEFCAIFTEAGILKLLSLGFPKEEIAAAIAYGFMGGYANKFVGNETFGEYASAQGGPFKGKGCLAALALHTGAEIHAFPHRQLFGALGAAIVVYNEIKRLKSSGIKAISKFRGLDIADIKYEKRIENCSKFIEKSCGVRDCKLQVYKIDNDEIFSGGLCPKGNTDTSLKKAPDYIKMYKKMLNKEISKFAKSVNECKDLDGPRILIPRTLTFLNERGVFYTAFLKYLGFEVFVSPESDDHIANLGLAHSNSEVCYPAKLQNGHVAFLKKYFRKGKDKMFLVNVLGSENDFFKTCPFISSAGFVAKEALNLDDSDILMPLLIFSNKNYKIKDDMWKEFKRVYNGTDIHPKIGKRQIAKAVEYADRLQNEFNEKVYSKGKVFIEKLKEKGEKIFIGIGRGYTVFDDKASSKIHELFIFYGLHFIPVFFLKRKDIDISNITHHMYWFQGQQMIIYNLMVAMDAGLYGVRESNFNCGPDAMLTYHEQKIMDIAQKPYLTLQTDGHNSNAQFGTRTLANYEVVKSHNPMIHLTPEDFKTYDPPDDDLHNRIMGIPNMGLERAKVLSALFKSIGYQTEVMPSMTPESEYYSRKYLITNNCQPLHIVFGDSSAWLHQKQEEGIDPNKKLALLIPEAGGPCRLGQYRIITRYFLDAQGFNKVPIIHPASYKDWDNIPVPARKRAIFRVNLIKAINANDILQNAQCRTRPYEMKIGETDRIYQILHEELLDIIERGANFKELKNFMHRAADKFIKIPKRNGRFPKVSMFGEVFERNHPLVNLNSIRKLEQYNLEVNNLPLSHMFEYNVNMQRIAYWHEKQYKDWLRSFLKSAYMKYVEKNLFEPFEKYLSDRKLKGPIELYDRLRKDNIFDLGIKGEAGVAIGECHELITGCSDETCGLYHILPFGCMQEGVSTSQIQSLIHNYRSTEKDITKRIIPYLRGVFADSELPNFDAEMAMFSEKCRIRKELHSLK